MSTFNNENNKIIRHFTLYAIALVENKYYVGITSHKDPFVRLRQHGGPLGARWTQKYKPLKPIQPLVLRDLGYISKTDAEKQEQALFEEFVKQYGLKNVRGGQITWTTRVYRIGSLYFAQPAIDGMLIIAILISLVLYILFAK